MSTDNSASQTRTASVDNSAGDEKKGAGNPAIDVRDVERHLDVTVKPPGPAWKSFAGFKFWVLDRDYHVWLMSSVFTLLFVAYPIQGVQTIRFPDTGSYILIVLYSAYFVQSMWATFFLDWWGLEWCLPWGPISYAVWIACMFSGNKAANLIGAAFFGWGAGLLWPAAGQLIAAVSTPHNRASNAGIYQFAFHLGIFIGGLVLGAVQKSFSNYNDQYAVFIAICCVAVIVSIVHAFSFRRRFRNQTKQVNANATGEAAVGLQRSVSGRALHRVQLDDGTVVYRSTARADLKSETAVVQDLALSGGKDPSRTTLQRWRDNFWQPVHMIFGNSVFGPLAPVIFVTGGMTQGWFNASFNLIVNKVGGDWNGWIYAISESWAMVASIAFGIFYDRLRSNYVASRYRWVMYVYVVAFYALCSLALGCWYMAERGVGNEPGQIKPSHFKAALSFAGAFYNIQLLALEVSVLTYLSTFLTYNADVAFSSKIGCEAAGYLLVFGLVNVLSPKWMIVVLFCVSVPANIVFFTWWHAPERPVATLLGEDNASVNTAVERETS